MQVTINGAEYTALPYRFPKTTREADYKLDGVLETAVTGGGTVPVYVYFKWTDGRGYYLPKGVKPAPGAVVEVVVAAPAPVAEPTPTPTPVKPAPARRGRGKK